jgi:GGDEF domain-containing protein
VVVEGAEPPAISLAKADRALYASKHAGRNRVTPFTPEVVAAEIA